MGSGNEHIDDGDAVTHPAVAAVDQRPPEERSGQQKARGVKRVNRGELGLRDAQALIGARRHDHFAAVDEQADFAIGVGPAFDQVADDGFGARFVAVTFW